MSKYLIEHGSTRVTPQSEAMREDQVANSAGGFVWAVDEWTRLRRFLILGSEGGSYYASERKLTKENITAVRECLRADGLRTVAEIVEISDKGRAPKNDPALFALACAISLPDGYDSIGTENKAIRVAAGKALPQVARIGTHLYHFVAFAEQMRGWGKVLRKAVAEWYDRKPEQLAYQAVKYRQRDGWSHRDLLRLAHPSNGEYNATFDWITHGDAKGKETIIVGFERAQAAKSPKEAADIVREYRLPREALLTEHLNSDDVWRALLDVDMPLTAMTRNLANMTRIGVLDSKEYRQKVIDAIGDKENIHKSRLHPMTLLIALRTYGSGQGMRGKHTWTPIPEIIDALDESFYLAFDNVETTGKSYLLGLDVSGSMGGFGYGYHGYGGVAGAPITPREASTAMALVTLHAEKDVEIMAFSTTFIPVNFSRRQRLDDACKMTHRMPFGGTDCSLPMRYAQQMKREVDTFAVYTDSETWAGNIHPKQALDQYRQFSGRPARSVVVGMVSNGFTIADPTDRGMLDVVGFDTAAPALISDFSAGRV